jgi:hypothetical protein
MNAGMITSIPAMHHSIFPWAIFRRTGPPHTPYLFLWSPDIYYRTPRLMDHSRLNMIGNRPNIHLPAASSSYRMLCSIMPIPVLVVPSPTMTNWSYLRFALLNIHCWIFASIYYARRSVTMNIGVLWFALPLWLDTGSLVGLRPRISPLGYLVWLRSRGFWFYTKYYG